MHFLRSFVVMSLAVRASSICFASVDTAGLTTDDTHPTVSSSNRPALPEAPGTLAASSAAGPGYVSLRPFSAVAVGVNVGAAGAGFAVATPLARKLNLRGGASFFSYSTNLTEDGVSYAGAIKFRSVSTSVDFFPFGGAFRISPGVTVYNGNHLTANASVAGGQSFTLNSVSYTSSTTTPVTGTFDLTLGRKVAPSVTMGFGNMIPHRTGQHWSVPFEVGVEFIGPPQIALNLTGNACQGTNCQPVQTTPSIQANVTAEQNNLNNDISALRFYPILSLGLSYKFGGGGKK